MPFSHHSHSGQFCPGHAQDSLEDVIQAAISKKMQVFCLTEHMPRAKEDFYPEEVTHPQPNLQINSSSRHLQSNHLKQVESGQTEEWHFTNEAAYWTEAVRLRTKYAAQIQIIIGFECEWIRPESKSLIERSLSRFPFEFFIGSLHHMHTMPIDYDREMYEKARDLAGGSDLRLFEDYFDAQLDMLQELKPLVVGHFDLIRLKSDDMERSFKSWEGGLGEDSQEFGLYCGINGAALRKGMSEPYPKAEICKEFVARGGRFCLSDDSHGVDQISLNFHKVLEFLDVAGIETLHYLKLAEPSGTVPDARFPRTHIAAISVEDVKKTAFFKVE
ncbi:Histidinol-phosphatase [Penicillium atrosanguineum]|nr:Histidinol-phosphatase [Penicillium atrosanguineum]